MKNVVQLNLGSNLSQLVASALQGPCSAVSSSFSSEAFLRNQRVFWFPVVVSSQLIPAGDKNG